MSPDDLRTQPAKTAGKKKPRAKDPRDTKEAVKRPMPAAENTAKAAPIPEEGDVEFDARNEAQPPAPAPAPRIPVSYEMGEEYLTQIFFDRTAGKYVGTVLEFPEVKAEGTTRDGVMTELSHQVQQKLVDIKMGGGRAPEPILQKAYPEKLEVPISQSLYRKLDVYSRQERVGLEQLVGEVLSALVERRGDRGHQQQRQQQHQQHQPGNDRNHQRYQHNRHHQQQHSQRNRGGNYNQGGGMDSGNDNFLEYVRNLEKRGGAAGKYRR